MTTAFRLAVSFGEHWDWRVKLIATILVDLAVIAFMVWLLWYSKWAKPRFCGECPSCRWSEAYEGKRRCERWDDKGASKEDVR